MQSHAPAPIASEGYTFDRVRDADLPMLSAWLHQPHVRAWWGEPTDEVRLIRGDINDPRIDQRVVRYHGVPLAYIQDYAVADWPQPHLDGQPGGTRAMDTFLGAPEMVGQGHGRRYVRARALTLFDAGAPRIVIDPDSANHAARSAYRGAGFVGEDPVQTADGPVVLMIFDPPNTGACR